MNRSFSLRRAALAVATLAVLTLAGTAQAQTVPLRGSGEGQVIRQVNPTPENPVGEQEYVAEGHLTLLGRISVHGTTFFTADGRVLPPSFFVVTAADGSTIAGRYSGTFAPIPGTPNLEFTVEAVWGEGTGRLAGLTGRSTITAVLDGLTGAFDWQMRGVWTLP